MVNTSETFVYTRVVLRRLQRIKLPRLLRRKGVKIVASPKITRNQVLPDSGMFIISQLRFLSYKYLDSNTRQ